MELIGGMARVAMHLIGILPFQAFPFLAGGLSADWRGSAFGRFGIITYDQLFTEGNC